MTRILVTGNSHVAALKLGWEALPPAVRAGVSVDFFAVRDPLFQSFDFTGPDRFGLPDAGAPAQAEAAEITRRFNGATEVSLAGYDLVALAGHNFGFRKFLNAITGHRIEGMLPLKRAHTLSEPALAAFADEMIDAFMPPAGWLDRVRPRVVAIARPRHSERGTVETPGVRLPVHFRLPARNPDAYRALHAFYDARVVARLARHGIAWLEQPPETLTAAGLTRAEFSRDAPILGTARDHDETDLAHMNADYGALCMAALLSRHSPTAQHKEAS